MSFLYAEKNTPFVLSPASLDDHLARGWYRMGGSIFTTHFLFFNGRPYSAVWIRQPLANYRFSKSQRKLMRRNASLFEIAWGPRVIDLEREELYQRYAADFDGRLSATITESLEDFGENSIYNTYEVTVREKVSGKLVALSYFDLGDTSAASILGIYDPQLKSFSLGYYTMLLEIQYCLERGFDHYYPGYVVPGYRRFDYKLRAGPSEFYNLRTNQWEPYSQEAIDEYGSTECQVNFLTQLLDRLAEVGIERRLLTYPLFEANLYDVWHDDYLPYPYLVYLGKDNYNLPIILAYDPQLGEFVIVQCDHSVQTQLLYNAGFVKALTGDNYYTQLLSIRNKLYATSSLELIVDVIHRGLQRT